MNNSLFAGLALLTIISAQTVATAQPATVYLSGVVRDFQRSHPDFDVMPIGGPGHYAGNIGLTIGADNDPEFAGTGFKVASQWLNSGSEPIAPHLYGRGSSGSSDVYLVNGPEINDSPVLDTWSSALGPYGDPNVGPAPNFVSGYTMPTFTVPTGLPWIDDGK